MFKHYYLNIYDDVFLLLYDSKVRFLLSLQ